MSGRPDQKHFRMMIMDSAECQKHGDLKLSGLGQPPQEAEQLKNQIRVVQNLCADATLVDQKQEWSSGNNPDVNQENTEKT